METKVYQEQFQVCITLCTGHAGNWQFALYSSGGSTLIFSVELLQLSKKPYFAIPTDRDFWMYAGGLLVVLLGGYELYRRATNKDPSKDKNGVPARTTNKRSKKKKWMIMIIYLSKKKNTNNC